MNFEAPLTSLVWITSFVSIGLTYLASWLIIPELGGDASQWWKLGTIITCGTLAGAIIPELVKAFTSVESRHTKEIVTSAQEGGASLGILSGFVAGNYSAYYLGLSMVLLMSIGYLFSQQGLHNLMVAEPVFAFGLVAFGFLGMGPVTIAVDSYGPVTDNAQSVFELSLIEQLPGIKQELKKANIKLEGVEKASITDSKKVVEICTRYAQKGMLNIFIAVFFSTLAFAFVEPFFFIGYLISIATFGLYQAIFMANAGGAWDNAKKIVEVELKQKGTPLHDATVIGDTVGDPFKDTSSVALNPIIKFTTLFGLLAVELAVSLTASQGSGLTHTLAAGFFVVSFFFVYRSFYGMRIKGEAA